MPFPMEASSTGLTTLTALHARIRPARRPDARAVSRREVPHRRARMGRNPTLVTAAMIVAATPLMLHPYTISGSSSTDLSALRDHVSPCFDNSPQGPPFLQPL